MKSLALQPAGASRNHAADGGFTILELMSVMAFLSIVLTLGAAGFRQYWLVHSLESAQGDVATQLRQIQARVASESHPFIYGARFSPGSSTWSLLKYDQGPQRLSTADDSCSSDGGQRTLSGAIVAAPPASSFTGGQGVDFSKCGGAYTTDVFVVFYAKGTATGGKVTLRSPVLDRTREIVVSPLTSRVEER